MTVAASVVRIKRFTVDAVTWTPIIAPIDCNACSVMNADAAGGAAVVMKLRTDDADANTEFSINPGQQYPFSGPFTPSLNTNNRFRFMTNDTAVFIKLASGSYSVQVSFF